MQLISMRALLGILVALAAAFGLLVIGVPGWVAVALAALIGWVAAQTVLAPIADRAEGWLTTPKHPGGGR